MHVYERAERFFLASYDRTRWSEAGFWIATQRVTVLESTTSDATLGAAVLAALSTCQVEVPVPPRGAKLESALFRTMGVRSNRAAMLGTLACVVTREPPDDALRIEPQWNGGPTGKDRGYSGIPGRAMELPAETDAPDLGRAVRLALATIGAIALQVILSPSI